MARANPAGAWTYDDLCSLPDDGRRYEIIEGERHGMPAPDSAQAITVVIILMALYPKVTRFGGRVAAAPPDGVFAGANPVQADVVVNLAEGTARVVRWGIEVPPDVPSEVFSPTNRIHDLLTRRALHARVAFVSIGSSIPRHAQSRFWPTAGTHSTRLRRFPAATIWNRHRLARSPLRQMLSSRSLPPDAHCGKSIPRGNRDRQPV